MENGTDTNFLSRALNRLADFIQSHTRGLVTFALVLILGVIAIRIILAVVSKNVNKSKIKGAAGDFLISAIKVALYLIYIIALLALLGVPTTSLVAMLSAFALAISLALQNTFSNVAAGLMIVSTKPFREGDFVDIGGTTGTVETITIFNTKLVTPDNKEVFLPNNTVSAANVINYSAKETRRLDLVFSASYDASPAKVKEAILGVIAKHPEIESTPAPMVRLTEHGESSLNYVTRVWVKQKDYWNVNFDLKEEVLSAFAEAGISVPYNQLDVHVIQ